MAIDITGRYFHQRYMRGGPAAWTLDRGESPVRAAVLHHTGGWYGAPLDAAAREAEEVARIDALARDHRARFGVGPGYHYVAFPGGRLYAVGKWGTHRAHAKGRNPRDGVRWNEDAVGIAAMGDYERFEPPPALLDALREALAEVRQIAGSPVPLLPHGLLRTVNREGEPFSQATLCPGRYLLPLARERNARAAAGGRAAVEQGLHAIERAVAGIRRELAR